jgi:hypothetical protein
VNENIFVMNADGTGVTQLTFTESTLKRRFAKTAESREYIGTELYAALHEAGRYGIAVEGGNQICVTITWQLDGNTTLATATSLATPDKNLRRKKLNRLDGGRDRTALGQSERDLSRCPRFAFE